MVSRHQSPDHGWRSAIGTACEVGGGFKYSLRETGVEEDIPGWITGDCHLGQYDQISTFLAGGIYRCETAFNVTFQVTNAGVDLCERYSHLNCPATALSRLSASSTVSR
jgi:hypothetical protein